MPLSTLETRWFFSGTLEETGPGIEAWFRTRAFGGPAMSDWQPAPPGWRRDRYLVIPGQDDLGVKWREGRLEIKGREASLGCLAFAPGIEGFCERWLKWLYAGGAIERRFLRLFNGSAAAGIVPVEKRRLQRCIRLELDGSAVEVGRDAIRERGVNVELAQIRIPGAPDQTQWSLAFEAFPGDPEMPGPVAHFVAGFLEGCPALPLAAEQSMGYPRWLRDFDRQASSG